MFRHPYLKGALKRMKMGKTNWRDLYYQELFRPEKNFTDPQNNLSSLSNSLFPYILNNYEKTMQDRKNYFCLYTDFGDFHNFYWLLFCLKVLDIHCISFPDGSTKDLFISKLNKEIGDNYYPISLIKDKLEVMNDIPKTFYGETMFGEISNKE
jgi:hypothetical protein